MTAHGMSRKCAKRPRSGSSNAGRTGAEILAPKYRGEALDRAKRLEPIIREMQNEGYSMRRMATELIQAEGENASRWWLAPTDSEDGDTATRRLKLGSWVLGVLQSGYFSKREER